MDFPALTLAMGLGGILPKSDQDWLLCSVWDRDTSPPLTGDGQASLTWLWAIFVSPWFKN